MSKIFIKKTIVVIVLLALFIFGLSSCSGNNDDGVIVKDRLLGKWKYQSESALDVNGKLVNEHVEDNGNCPLDTFEFFYDNTYSNVFYEYEPNICTDGSERIDIWDRNEDVFKLTEKEKVHTFKIVVLTDDMLVLDIPLSREEAADYELNVTTLRHHFKRI